MGWHMHVPDDTHPGERVLSNWVFAARVLRRDLKEHTKSIVLVHAYAKLYVQHITQIVPNWFCC